jgi:hypothetical protein
VKSKYLPFFNIPFSRNGLFTGQEEILEIIHKKLVLEARSDLTSSYVLYGLGGVGKTQIAIEYSYRHRADFDIIYWLRADNYETLLMSYLRLYNNPSFKTFSCLNLGDENNSESIAMQIKSWFENCQDITWLLIVDNADNLETISNQKIKTIASLIPKGRGGCVLVTSRNRSANGQLAIMGQELDVMDEDNATKFLFKCSQATSDESEEAGLLVKTLGRLPLAIECHITNFSISGWETNPERSVLWCQFKSD